MQDRQFIADLAHRLHGLGMRHVVVCPGSRNAPLIQSFHQSGLIRCHSIVDERSAGYVALGMARELQQAVGVLVTSGTAVLNLAPAMAEAYHQQIPLVAFSADRPEERISQFDNQIIDQTEAFPDHSKGFCELPVDLDGESERTEALDMVQFMLESALREPRGPVHFNVLLEEPLYEPLPPGRAYESKGRLDFGEAEDDDQEETEEMEVWSDNGGSGTEPGGTLVLVGAGVPDPEMDRALQALEGRPDVAVVCEHLSNAGGGVAVHHPELLLAALPPEGWGDLKPGRVIALGGHVVSKRLRLLLQNIEGLQVWPMDRADFLTWCASDGLSSSGGGVPDASREPSYRDRWRRAEQDALARASKVLEQLDFSFLHAVQELSRQLVPGTVFHLGNSASVRYALLAPRRGDVRYDANRGTSGIDGSFSSAVGAAMVSDRPHVLVLGDLSFVYDSNALWNKSYPENLTVVVLNDNGGGIFRLLEGPGRTDFSEEYQVTDHPVSLEHLALAFGKEYRHVGNISGLRSVLQQSSGDRTAPLVLEVACESRSNAATYGRFFELLRTDS